MKDTDDIANLATGFIDQERKDALFSEIEHDSEAEDVYNKLKVAWAFLSSTNKMPEYKIEDSYKKLQVRLNPDRGLFRLKVIRFLRYAAILILFLSILTPVYYLKKQTTHKAELRYTSIVAKYKEMSQVILPDSSVVWLNSGTTLTYNSDYSFHNRELSVKGEAFLDVRKNKDIPLIVSCNNLKVKVLGTKFNVRAYPEDCTITVVLKEGKVELLHAKDKSFNYTLSPGEIAKYNDQSNKIFINTANVDDYTAWKDGVMVFKDTPMDEVIKRLERKFDIEISAENPAIYKPAFNATFKEENLNKILDYIQLSCHINYQVIKDDSNKLKIKLY
jgi:transmembrane sensor